MIPGRRQERFVFQSLDVYRHHRVPSDRLMTPAGHRGFQIVREHENAGIIGGKGRDKRPAFDQMLKDAVRRRFDVCLVWSMDRPGRSVLLVAQAMEELDAAGVALISEQQGAGGTSPFGKAMM